jgi:hypothetical protein
LNLQDIKGWQVMELLFLLLLPCILQQNVLRRPQLWILDRVVIPVASGILYD